MTKLHTKFPVTFAQLAELMKGETVPLNGRTRLVEDLRLAPRAIELLALEIAAAFGVTFGESQVEAWKTLDDICASIAGGLELQAA